MSVKARLIDEIYTEIRDKDILDEISCISISKAGLQELLDDYAEEFKNELIETGRSVSKHDIQDYFGKPLFIQEQSNGKQYTLLRPV